MGTIKCGDYLQLPILGYSFLLDPHLLTFMELYKHFVVHNLSPASEIQSACSRFQLVITFSQPVFATLCTIVEIDRQKTVTYFRHFLILTQAKKIKSCSKCKRNNPEVSRKSRKEDLFFFILTSFQLMFSCGLIYFQ